MNFVLAFASMSFKWLVLQMQALVLAYILTLCVSGWAQVMGLLEVVTTNAGARAELRGCPKAPDVPAVFAPGNVTIPSPQSEAAASFQAEGQQQPSTEAIGLRVDEPRPDMPVDRADSLGTSTSGVDQRADAVKVLLSLPEPELCNLCKLLAREG
jgi:hypothetical protein